jgi:hypothetical protein
MHEEASQVLRSNRFVVVSYRWPELAIVKHMLGVPIVSEDQARVAKFRGHVLRVHLQTPPATINIADLKVESFLVVAQELPAICTLINYVYSMVPSPACHVTHLPGDPPNKVHLGKLRHDNPKSVLPILKLRLEVDKDAQTSRELTKSLLSSFRSITYGSQDVKVQNVCEGLTHYIHDLKKTMAPRSVWTNALAWHSYELVRDLKKEADALVDSRDFLQALTRYHAIWTMFDSCSIFHLEPRMYSPEVVWVVSRLDAMMIGSAIGESLIRIERETVSAGDPMAIVLFVSDVVDHAMNLPGDEKGLPAAILLLSEWHNLLVRFLLSRDMDTLRVAKTSMEILLKKSGTMLQKSEGRIPEYFKHDLARITDHLNSPGVSLGFKL